MEDLIRRSDAIKAFVEEMNGVNVEGAIKVVDDYLQIRECDEVWESIRAIRDCLECAKDEIAEYIPSADRPQGKWIEQEDCWQCSECGDEFVLDVDVKPIDARMHYCPNCGADMRKGADDES